MREVKKTVSLRLYPSLKKKLHKYASARLCSVSEIFNFFIAQDLCENPECPLDYRVFAQKERLSDFCSFQIDAELYESFRQRCANMSARPARRLLQIISYYIKETTKESDKVSNIFEDTTLRILVWNIRGGASMCWNNSYRIPHFVTDRITRSDAHIIILTEFVVASGFDYLQAQLEGFDYAWFLSHKTSRNGILIAVKKGLILPCNEKGVNPYYTEDKVIDIEEEKMKILQIELTIKTKKLFVIGAYMGSDSPGWEIFDEHLSSLPQDCYILCAGDFNVFWARTWNTKKNAFLPKTANSGFLLFTPEFDATDSFSFVHKDGTKVGIDHTVTRGFKGSKNAEYHWDFINWQHYGRITKHDYKSGSAGIPGNPDHAILTVELEF